jgi:hypothetical protein
MDTPLKVDMSLKAAAEYFEASISHPGLNINALVAGMTPPNLPNGQSPCLNYHVCETMFAKRAAQAPTTT